ncbi:MAG: hypothetical protein JRM80_01785 [Nitrososphaerota archaeon]|nr:hypothetical protein [Nitrososphaerota archaeon]
MSVADLSGLEQELTTPIQNKHKESAAYRRRSDNLEWIKALPLAGLGNGEVELSIPMAQTARKELILIQYPGKESRKSERRDWSNPRDFRPKYLKYGASSYGPDLTFSQLWDPLVDNLRSLEHQYDREQFAAVLGILFYRMAFMIDYSETPVGESKVTVFKGGNEEGTKLMSFGRFWNYKPPKETTRIMGKTFPDWGGMSFEAYLQYNSLLAWNEDGKSFAKFADWNLSKSIGRINTLLTHVRVIGFITGKVELSALLGDFTRRRGMSPAPTDELMSICGQYIRTEGDVQGTL